jgi:L-seryl-tRNA(Ser) seleniumtransferase
MIRERPADVKHRAERIAASLRDAGTTASVRRSEAAIGGGSVPGSSLPSWAVEAEVDDAPALAARLRTGNPPVFCRVDGTTVGFDARTVADDEVDDLVRAVRYAREGTRPGDA